MVGSSDERFYCVFCTISIRSVAYIHRESHELPLAETGYYL